MLPFWLASVTMFSTLPIKTGRSNCANSLTDPDPTAGGETCGQDDEILAHHKAHCPIGGGPFPFMG
jgi:hypothetical protein